MRELKEPEDMPCGLDVGYDYCVLKFTAIKGRHYCDLQTENFNIGDLE